MKLGLRGALGIVLSVALLAYALRDVHFAEVWAVLRQSDPWLFAAATIAGTLIFPLRALRWRVILEPIAGRLPFGMLWRSTAVGMMVNNVVPARAGELVRAFALTRETRRVDFAGGIASLAVDRAFDAIVVLLLMLGAMLDPRFAAGAGIGESRTAVTATVIFGATGVAALLVILYLIVFFPARLISLYELLSRRVAPRFEARGRLLLRSFADGLGVLRHPGRFAAVFGWTLAHWLMHALGFWLGFRAVGIDVPFSAALVVQGLVAISVALPAAPGFWGVFEVAGGLGLALYGVPANLAISWALGFHLLTFIPITVIGAMYFARLGLRLRDVGNAGDAAADAEAPDAARAGTPR